MSDEVDPEQIRRLETAVSRLPHKQRQIFLAHRLDALSYDEIARRTGLTERAVEHHMARAIYKLVKQMDGGKLSWWERLF
jgi:RNA polymerase sigma-70 factor (ECF subfamily)